MKLSKIKSTLTKVYGGSKQPVMLWGPPGVAKSSITKEAATELGIECIDLRLSLLEPIDLRGFPVVDKGKVVWALPSFLPTKGKGILFLDEIVQANPSMQAAASQLILDRRIGDYVLPDGWMVVAAGNRKSDRASTSAMPSHIANRFVHLNVEVSVEEWIAWATKAGIDMRVIAYIKWRGVQMLHHFDPQQKGEAFCSPRSWEFVSKMLQAGIDDIESLQGCVGEKAGTEFSGFLRIFEKLPSIDNLLLNPMQAELPGDPAVLFALTTTLVHRVDKDNLSNISKFFGRLTDAQRPEFAVIALKEVAAKKPQLTNTRAYTEWAAAMSHITA
jgi:hypothetical protein